MRKRLLLATAITAATSAVPAAAVVFAGKTVQTAYFFPTTVNAYALSEDFIVGTSSPRILDGIASISVSATQITLTATCGGGCTWATASFNGFVLTDFYATVDPFTSVTINAATSYAGFDASRVSVDANNIYVNWQGLPANGTIILDVNGAGAVPEPASWAMLITGFGLVGAAARRRRVLAA